MKVWQIALGLAVGYVVLVNLRGDAWSAVTTTCNTQYPAGWNTTPMAGTLAANCAQAAAFQSKWGWLPVLRVSL